MKKWHLNLISCIAIVLVIGVSDAFGDPRPINNLVGSNSLSTAQQGQIEDFAKFYCNNLSSYDIILAEDAKKKLLEPLRALVVTPHFLSIYTKRLVPYLKPVIKGDSPYAAVNAFQVIGFIGTDEALDVIENHLSFDDEKSFAKRLWAVKAFVIAVDSGNLSANQQNPVLRQLGLACKAETQPMILHSQFNAIAKVKSPIARDVLLGAVSAKLDGLAAQENPSELMGVIYPALISLRDQYLILAPNQQRALGTNIAPTLCKVFNVSLAHWNAMQLDEKLKSKFAISYEGANRVAEGFLKTIARKIGSQETPRTQIADAWADGDKSRFEAEHKMWHDFVSRPPFGG